MHKRGRLLRVEMKINARNLVNKPTDITGKYVVKIAMNYAQTWN
jgi:hypothetical protein